MLLSSATATSPQARRPPSAVPKIDVEKYVTELTLNPDAHELRRDCRDQFQTLEETAVAVFEVSENVSIQKVLGAAGVGAEFGQDEAGPGLLACVSRGPPGGEEPDDQGGVQRRLRS